MVMFANAIRPKWSAHTTLQVVFVSLVAKFNQFYYIFLGSETDIFIDSHKHTLKADICFLSHIKFE